MKILHVIFSCNRLQYLTKTLDSLKNLDYGSHEVTRLIVDDYPRTRNDSIFQLLAKTHKTLLWLNTENKGLSVTYNNIQLNQKKFIIIPNFQEHSRFSLGYL